MNYANAGKLPSVKRIPVKPGDILLFEVEIGRMPSQKAKVFFNSQIEALKASGMIPKGVGTLFVAMRDGKPLTNVKVLAKTELDGM